jgi:quercetin dioxygenase-like cupin family protein
MFNTEAQPTANTTSAVADTGIQRREFLRSGAAAAFALATANPARAQVLQTRTQENRMDIDITRVGSKPSQKGPAEWFTGSVRVEILFGDKAPSRVSSANVAFEPGARTAWHTHPLGQHIIITSGVGWVQQEGGVVQEVRPGDVVWFPPNVKHWHGASPENAMTHIAIQEAKDGSAVEWMEHVTDEQYKS